MGPASWDLAFHLGIGAVENNEAHVPFLEDALKRQLDREVHIEDEYINQSGQTSWNLTTTKRQYKFGTCAWICIGTFATRM